jgi:hypothetical protein
VEVVVAWFLFVASLQGRGEWGRGGGEEDRQNIYNFMFCDGEDYREWRKKSLNTRGNTLNTEHQVPSRHSFNTTSPTMWSHLMGIHHTFRVIYCFHFNGVKDISPFPSRSSKNCYQPIRLRGILPQNSCFGGLDVAYWPLVPKFAGSDF